MKIKPPKIKAMPLTILIAPDKFKGTLTAGEAARAIARGWGRARPQDTLEVLPMSDGGDGFGEVTGKRLGAKVQTVNTVDAAHRPCQARWWWAAKTKTVIIESASVIGLAMLPPGKFHPFELDTFGLGAVIRAASARGAQRCFIGIGGSATNDGGFGLARALGWEFLDDGGGLIQRWTDLHRLAQIRAPKRQRWFDELIIAVDVQNPLLGSRGATRIFGPQKGLQPSELMEAERNLRKLAQTLGGKSKLQTQPGAGAAGGLGFGLLAFLRAEAEPGFDLFARYAKLEARLRTADLVITGEGRLDESTLMGKGVGQIARRCRRLKIPCIALVGMKTDPAQARADFAQARALTEMTTVANAQSKPAFWLERLAKNVAAEWGF